MEPIKFLMTDTGAGCTAACKAALEAKGVEVHVCEKNGAAALEALRSQRPQAVLLDAFMPGLDAISVKQRYEQEGGRAQFYVTGAFQNEQLEQGLQHLEERCQHALGVVAREVAPELEHLASEARANNLSILARVWPEVLLSRLTRAKP